MAASPPDTPTKRQRRREEMEQMFFVLLKRQQMREVVHTMGAEFGCPVCHGVLDMATLVNCGHMFCQKCIRTWCVSYGRRSCPVCRVTIVARIRAQPVDRFIRRCLEDAGEHETLKELLASEAAATPEESAVFQSERAPVRATSAAAVYSGMIAMGGVGQTSLPGTTSTTSSSSNSSSSSSVATSSMRSATVATSAHWSGGSWIASFGMSSD